MAATRLIFISNFRLLVQRFCHILTNFLVALHLNIISPQACAKILLLSVCSLVPEVCGVYSIIAVCTLEHTMWLNAGMFLFPTSSNPLFSVDFYYVEQLILSYTRNWCLLKKPGTNYTFYSYCSALCVLYQQAWVVSS